MMRNETMKSERVEEKFTTSNCEERKRRREEYEEESISLRTHMQASKGI